MNKFSTIIHDLYNKYLPVAEKANISLDLDFPDAEKEISGNPAEVKAELEKQLKEAIKRSNNASVKVSIKKGKITLTDSGTTLSMPLQDALSGQHVSVKSRVGFGTTVTINLPEAKAEIKETKTKATSTQKLTIKPKTAKKLPAKTKQK